MTNEFNLSVLENVTNFSSPLKSPTNYTALFSLVKDEFDIGTEDGTEPQKFEQNLSPHKQRSKSVEGIIKLPHKRRSLKSISDDTTQKKVHFTPPQRSKEQRRSRENCTLGATKPLRSFRSSSRKSCTGCQNFDTSFNSSIDKDVTINDTSLKNTSEGQEPGETNNSEKNSNLISNDLQQSELNQVPEVSSVISENVQTQSQTSDSEYVESSQTTTSSNLRRKLSICQSSLKNTVPPTSDTQQSLGSEKSEDEHNFSLAISPESESRTSTRERSLTPPRVETNSFRDSENQKLDCSQKTISEKLDPKRNESDTSSPLKGLTQELENCIGNTEYLTDEILSTELFERPNFSFEAIDLLNEYANANETASNEILSKILSSPDKDAVKEEPVQNFKSADDETASVKDPLHIDENEHLSRAMPEKIESPEKNDRKKSQRPKWSLKRCFSFQESTENVDPTSPKRRRSTRKKSIQSKPSSDEYLADKYESDVSEKGTVLKCIKNVKNIKREESTRRRSSRLQTIEKEEFSDSDDEFPDLTLTATEICNKIEAAIKKEALSKQIWKKLDNMNIKLRHKPPPQHEVETRAGSKALTYEMQEEFIKFAPISKELYSAKEDEILKTNWKNFCKDHDWNPANYKPFLRFKHGDKLLFNNLEERRKFVQFLAKDLPNRPLCSVYNRFKILYGKSKLVNMRYTHEEDMQILAYILYTPVESVDKKYLELSKVLHRSRQSIWKRFQKLSEKYCGDDDKKGDIKIEWSLSLVEKYISTLLDVTLSEDIGELKDAFIPKVVWLKMQKKMNIPEQELRNFWEYQLHMQLFVHKPIYMNQIKIMIIEYIYAKGFHDFSEIKWAEVAKDFDGYTKHYLRRLFNQLSKRASVNLRTRNFKEILTWLYGKKIKYLMTKPSDRWLPRLIYKDNELHLLEEDVKILKFVK